MLEESDLIEQTSAIVAAYVAYNAVPLTELPTLLASVHSALVSLRLSKREPAPAPPPQVSIRRSITPDYLISLEDGKKYRMLKRHLRGLGMTPDEYRTKWGLPRNYPMVAPSYGAMRSELSRMAGFGQVVTKAAAAKAAKKANQKIISKAVKR